MKHIAANMGDVLDGWGQHVYWFYNDTGRLEYRLRDIRHLLNEVMPAEQRKPTYMMEDGIRGIAACAGKPSIANTSYAADPSCPEIQRTNIAGFQQFWFAVGSAQLGFVGAAKWDAYWGVTTAPCCLRRLLDGRPRGGRVAADAVVPLACAALPHDGAGPAGRPHAAVGLERLDGADARARGPLEQRHGRAELAAYSGPDGELTILGLDTNGRALNGVSADAPSQSSIGALPANKAFTLAVWNAAGDGKNTVAATVTTNAAGVARFEVPLHAAFSLTTVPVA